MVVLLPNKVAMKKGQRDVMMELTNQIKEFREDVFSGFWDAASGLGPWPCTYGRPGGSYDRRENLRAWLGLSVG